jgi:hypothetical protein
VYRQTHALTSPQLKALNDIVACRTAALGGHVEECDRCGYKQPSYWIAEARVVISNNSSISKTGKASSIERCGASFPSRPSSTTAMSPNRICNP